MVDGHGDAPCQKNLTDKEAGGTRRLVLLRGALNCLPERFRSVVVVLQVSAVVRSQTGGLRI
jgi:hypothetical protein